MLQFPLLPPLTTTQQHCQQIAGLLEILAGLPKSPEVVQHIFHAQLLKSSLFSARIEGNTLTLSSVKDVDLSNPREKEQQEISNVLKAIERVHTLAFPLTISAVQELHTLVTKDLDARAGKFRTESSAIFDQYGTVVYLTPEPAEAAQMLEVLLDKMSLQAELPWQQQLVLAGACHYYFEKAHPFLDGNGRTGRVLLQYQLRQIPGISGLVLPLDEYFDQNRRAYYDYLEKNTRHIDGFLDFFLDGVAATLTTYIRELQAVGQNSQSAGAPTSTLSRQLPRRQEIFHIIEDHPLISLDSIARRFPTIPRRTLAYDVAALCKAGLVEKLGETRGVVYQVKEK
jgi:Fic family protein